MDKHASWADCVEAARIIDWWGAHVVCGDWVCSWGILKTSQISCSCGRPTASIAIILVNFQMSKKLSCSFDFYEKRENTIKKSKYASAESQRVNNP